MKKERFEEPIDSRQPAMLGDPDPHASHLWTPWRMAYVAGTGNREHGCIFCNRLTGSNDIDNLLVYRGERVFSIMNLYPYNTGHLMIVPNEHVPSPELLDPEALADSALLMQHSVRALRMALGCEGFNIGINVGAPAGAGVTEHMHQHIVPRWTGDANFLPILGGTMVMPELLPVTYAKIRAEMFRIDDPAHPVAIYCFDASGESVAIEAANQHVLLPFVLPTVGEPVWRTAHQLLVSAGIDAQLSGWVGSDSANPGQGSDLSFLMTAPAASPTELQFIPVEAALRRLSSSRESEILQQAWLRNRASFQRLD